MGSSGAAAAGRFPCARCGAVLPSKSARDSHQRAVHHRAEWACRRAGCSLVFATRHKRDAHVETEHSSPDALVCPACRVRFHSRRNLHRHLLSNRGRRQCALLLNPNSTTTTNNNHASASSAPPSTPASAEDPPDDSGGGMVGGLAVGYISDPNATAAARFSSARFTPPPTQPNAGLHALHQLAGPHHHQQQQQQLSHPARQQASQPLHQLAAMNMHNSPGGLSLGNHGLGGAAPWLAPPLPLTMQSSLLTMHGPIVAEGQTQADRLCDLLHSTHCADQLTLQILDRESFESAPGRCDRILLVKDNGVRDVGMYVVNNQTGRGGMPPQQARDLLSMLLDEDRGGGDSGGGGATLPLLNMHSQSLHQRHHHSQHQHHHHQQQQSSPQHQHHHQQQQHQHQDQLSNGGVAKFGKSLGLGQPDAAGGMFSQNSSHPPPSSMFSNLSHVQSALVQ